MPSATEMRMEHQNSVSSLYFTSGAPGKAQPVRGPPARALEPLNGLGPLNGHGDGRGLDVLSLTLLLFSHCLRTNITVT